MKGLPEFLQVELRPFDSQAIDSLAYECGVYYCAAHTGLRKCITGRREGGASQMRGPELEKKSVYVLEQ